MSTRAALGKLASHSALYGIADVAGNAINVLLVPLYTAYLSPTEYGHLALLLLLGTLAKILFRVGLDGAFLRLYYQCETPEAKRRLAGSIFLFSTAFGTLLLAATWLGRGTLHRLLLGGEGSPIWVVLAVADVWVAGLAFIPMMLLRIDERPGLVSAYSSGRHLSNTLLKILLVVRGFGVAGVLVADLTASTLFGLAMLPRLRGRIALVLDMGLLRQALAFGLPKVPHGLLLQLQNLADRWILDQYVTRADVGLYQMGYTLGGAIKFPISAFEPAWGPFVYARVGEPDAKPLLARLATYAWAVFVGVALGLAVLGPELLTLLTPGNPAFRAAAPVIAPVALAYLLHGAFLLGSIGIGVARQTRWYPAITAVSAAINIGANLALVPHHGMLGAAWATVAAYAAMAASGITLSQRVYPLPHEWLRLAAVSASALCIYVAQALLAPEALWPGVAVKLALLASFPLLLALSGFLRSEERDWLRRRLRRR